jgi:hypothetical protein
MAKQTVIDKWANFLANEKLEPKKFPPKQKLQLIELAQALANIQSPQIRPYKAKLASRNLVCNTAIRLSIDLMAFHYHGKPALSRGLLDAWNKEYENQFGSTLGTTGEKENVRRTIRRIKT